MTLGSDKVLDRADSIANLLNAVYKYYVAHGRSELSMQKFTLVPLAGPEDSNSSLGNQLFQLSFGLFLKLQRDENVRFYLRGARISDNSGFVADRNPPIYSLLSPHELVGQSRISDALLRMASHLPPTFDYHDVQEVNFDGVMRRIGGIRIASGYFQNHKFVDAVKDELLARFHASPLFRSAYSLDREHLAVHARYGDYVSKPKNVSRYGVLSAEYYLDAVSHLAKKCEFHSIVIVSDEPKVAWESIGVHLKRHSKLDVDMGVGTLVDDFCTLASSRGVVMSNSTFSWWGAWLASILRDAAVALPVPWYLDLSGGTPGLVNPRWFQIPR